MIDLDVFNPRNRRAAIVINPDPAWWATIRMVYYPVNDNQRCPDY